MAFDDYEQAISFIHGRTKFKKIPTLARMRLFLKYLGNPESGLEVIHVTGTNGKGSTVAFLRELLEEQGLRVGTFTSPFIVRFNERIQINKQMIPDDKLLNLVNFIVPIVTQLDEELADAEGGPTEFEIVTALMFLYFSQERVDIAVVEVGIGGTFDSTNVISKPLVSVITTVAHDHAKLLGNSLAQIAGHKAGIIKENRPVVIGNIPEEALDVIKKKAEEKNAKLYTPSENYSFKEASKKVSWGEVIDYEGFGLTINDLQTSLMGEFQRENAAVALSAFLIVSMQKKWHVNSKEIRSAIKKATWPGRFEAVSEKPLVVLDGAHNVAAIDMIAKTIRKNFKNQHVYIIAAMLADKQPREMFAQLSQLPNTTIYGTTFAGPRPVAKVKDVTEKSEEIEYSKNWQEALVKIVAQMSEEDIILITGSLYFVSEVRHYFLD
ncbi:bifunctional folylpolyglutamate synthase/dihydrofolate synthase [Liquorilactobacillus mali]|uniref:Dihydrofolate synthase/folylpolyglutamate synthase n=1 Tax=Liquorilactobacillus mali KCTC 3596 = DSM 20444 TaxID=1046596 RepID=J1F634_9LACO|nr:folylpolyglutamate synthase/dihydrofolate synthase family protein [Liquorilactobacillus mali]EJF02169.1 Folylpolyglutamate synthase / Dihydrofolate synthase [Liquorilactobacillus mali KCTC 3596 = DSM 20444]KRN10225.1 folylpolyglutamate synthase dihydrofolate synthase [Liquorilactobacillus mali KCTC 3596 = DSM 20444]MDC7952772.1 bifunctional folylpolyglutamate synthase/dihydrofolate synthase [Liquorilactobacillus mali]MDV7757952.1 bifunctional folylpolyglutamate synthase/dihydrofolate synthas